MHFPTVLLSPPDQIMGNSKAIATWSICPGFTHPKSKISNLPSSISHLTGSFGPCWPDLVRFAFGKAARQFARGEECCAPIENSPRNTPFSPNFVAHLWNQLRITPIYLNFAAHRKD
jgi:hypothetical protein